MFIYCVVFPELNRKHTREGKLNGHRGGGVGGDEVTFKCMNYITG